MSKYESKRSCKLPLSICYLIVSYAALEVARARIANSDAIKISKTLLKENVSYGRQASLV